MKLFIKTHGLNALLRLFTEKDEYKISYFNIPVRLDISILKIVEKYILFEKNTGQDFRKVETVKFIEKLLYNVFY